MGMQESKQVILGIFAALVVLACTDVRTATMPRMNNGSGMSSDSGLSASDAEVLDQGVQPNGDDDGDGLSNSEEATLGTNPNKKDSDDDGYSDDDDVENNNHERSIWSPIFRAT